VALFLIRREVQDQSNDDIEAAGYRANACAFHYQGLRWITSYLDRAAGRLMCLYEAQSAEQIRDHSRRALIPCNEVVEVTQIFPENFAGGTGAIANLEGESKALSI
jgi:hypothetical protein